MGENFSLRFNPCHSCCFQILLLLFYMYVCMLAPMYYIEHGSQMITFRSQCFLSTMDAGIKSGCQTCASSIFTHWGPCPPYTKALQLNLNLRLLLCSPCWPTVVLAQDGPSLPFIGLYHYMPYSRIALKEEVKETRYFLKLWLYQIYIYLLVCVGTGMACMLKAG